MHKGACKLELELQTRQLYYQHAHLYPNTSLHTSLHSSSKNKQDRRQNETLSRAMELKGAYLSSHDSRDENSTSKTVLIVYIGAFLQQYIC